MQIYRLRDKTLNVAFVDINVQARLPLYKKNGNGVPVSSRPTQTQV